MIILYTFNSASWIISQYLKTLKEVNLREVEQ